MVLVISLSESLKGPLLAGSSVHVESLSSWRGNMKSLFTVIYNGIQVGMTLSLNAVHMLKKKLKHLEIQMIMNHLKLQTFLLYLKELNTFR